MSMVSFLLLLAVISFSAFGIGDAAESIDVVISSSCTLGSDTDCVNSLNGQSIENLQEANADAIHTNSFVVTSGTVVKVRDYNPSNGEGGKYTIAANDFIKIDGSIVAAGAGMKGGSGGSAGTGGNDDHRGGDPGNPGSAGESEVNTDGGGKHGTSGTRGGAGTSGVSGGGGGSGGGQGGGASYGGTGGGDPRIPGYGEGGYGQSTLIVPGGEGTFGGFDGDHGTTYGDAMSLQLFRGSGGSGAGGGGGGGMAVVINAGPPIRNLDGNGYGFDGKFGFSGGNGGGAIMLNANNIFVNGKIDASGDSGGDGGSGGEGSSSLLGASGGGGGGGGGSGGGSGGTIIIKGVLVELTSSAELLARGGAGGQGGAGGLCGEGKGTDGTGGGGGSGGNGAGGGRIKIFVDSPSQLIDSSTKNVSGGLYGLAGISAPANGQGCGPGAAGVTNGTGGSEGTINIDADGF